MHMKFNNNKTTLADSRGPSRPTQHSAVDTSRHFVKSMAVCGHSFMSTDQILAKIYAYFLFGGFAAKFNRLQGMNGFEKKKICPVTFVRLGVSIICAEFGEDLTRFVAAEKFSRFLIKSNIVAT